MDLNPALVDILNLWKKQHPFRGTIEERKTKFLYLHDLLNHLYSRNLVLEFGPITSESDSIPGSSTEVSYYSPTNNKIHLEGKLSVITFLHEWGHATLGHSEELAQQYAITHFKHCFPKSASRLVQVDGFAYIKPKVVPQ